MWGVSVIFMTSNNQSAWRQHHLEDIQRSRTWSVLLKKTQYYRVSYLMTTNLLCTMCMNQRTLMFSGWHWANCLWYLLSSESLRSCFPLNPCFIDCLPYVQYWYRRLLNKIIRIICLSFCMTSKWLLLPLNVPFYRKQFDVEGYFLSNISCFAKAFRRMPEMLRR